MPITERRDAVARQSRDRLAQWLDMHPRELACVPRSPAVALDGLVTSASRAAAGSAISRPALADLLELGRSLEGIAQSETAVGLAYRRLAEARLRGVLDETPRAQRVTVLLATVDGIDMATARHGDEAGRRLVDEVELRLRRWAPKEATLERLGGNVFVVILPAIGERAAPKIGNEMGAAVLGPPVAIDGHVIDLRISIGSGSSTSDSDPASIVAAADRALVRATRHGGGRMVNTRLTHPEQEPEGEVTRRFGQRIRELRIESGIPVEEVARRSGLHRTYIAGIESGHRHPTLRNIVKLAIGLGRSPADVLETV